MGAEADFSACLNSFDFMGWMRSRTILELVLASGLAAEHGSFLLRDRFLHFVIFVKYVLGTILACKGRLLYRMLLPYIFGVGVSLLVGRI